jgi:hypothetical protein
VYVRLKLSKLNEIGDTIVEVLIAVTVLGFVLAGTAKIIDTDILTIEDHNEHAQAIQLLESQIEDLRVYGGGSGGSTECFTLFSGNVIAQSSMANPGGGPGHDHCIVQSSGVKAFTTTNPAYKINITPPSAANNYIFNVQVTWNNVLGSQNQTSLEYRTQ